MKEEKMSNLYMNTTEFAALVVNALDEQDYFKRDQNAHPGDIAIAFSTVAETIGSAMSWAIGKEHEVKQKKAMMRTTTLSKNTYYTDTTSSSKTTYSPNSILPQDEEVAPALLEAGEPLLDDDWILGYSEWKKSGKPKKVK
jgi:hypothetical protein